MKQGRSFMSLMRAQSEHVQNSGDDLYETFRRMYDHTDKNPFWEPFQAPEMLFISSPTERKVSYVHLENFQAKGEVLPLVDAGLVGPSGLAWDGPRSALYICDGNKIYRVEVKAFKCTRQCKGVEYQLRTEGNRFVVVEDVVTQWASVDHEGNLYYSDQMTNSVNKLSVEAINMITNEQLLPRELVKTTEPETAGEESAAEHEEGLIGDIADIIHVSATTKPLAPGKRIIVQLYEKGVSHTVGTPAGVSVSGGDVYWANQMGGFTAGSVAKGRSHPHATQPSDGDGGPAFPSEKIASNIGGAYGIVVTSNKVVYSATEHCVYGAGKRTNEVVDFNCGLSQPRGLAWDGDNTVYVADELNNKIFSIPVGELKANAPVSKVVDIHGPFGLAMMSSSDPIWEPFQTLVRSSTHEVGSGRTLLIILASVVFGLNAGSSPSHL